MGLMSDANKIEFEAQIIFVIATIFSLMFIGVPRRVQADSIVISLNSPYL